MAVGLLWTNKSLSYYFIPHRRVVVDSHPTQSLAKTHLPHRRRRSSIILINSRRSMHRLLGQQGGVHCLAIR